MLANAAKAVDVLAVALDSRAPTADIASILACREAMYSILCALECLGIVGDQPSNAPAVLARVHQTLAALDRHWSTSCAAVSSMSPPQRLAILTGPLAGADDLLERMVKQGAAHVGVRRNGSSIGRTNRDCTDGASCATC